MPEPRRYHQEGQVEEVKLDLIRQFVTVTKEQFGTVYDSRQPDAAELVQAMDVVEDLLETLDELVNRPAKLKVLPTTERIWSELFQKRFGYAQTKGTR
ncbi:hypothetical protein SEA_THERESITA_54 [Microbacterium phage Theresita]|nr:hypothetical protein SEA_THERESITA_54 [Microbacterium phage Theresita]